jgi:hypothetical protein
MPRRGQRSGFRFAIANNAGDDEMGIVEHRAERQLAPNFTHKFCGTAEKGDGHRGGHVSA